MNFLRAEAHQKIVVPSPCFDQMPQAFFSARNRQGLPAKRFYERPARIESQGIGGHLDYESPNLFR